MFDDFENEELHNDEELFAKSLAISLLASLIIYSVFVGVALLDLKVQEKLAAAFGESQLGIEAKFTVVIVETLLFLPAPFFMYHFVFVILHNIERQRSPRGAASRQSGSLAREREQSRLRRSIKFALIGFLYAMAIAAAWIVYAAFLGI